MISITTFSETSIVVQLHADEEMLLWKDHVLTFLVGVVFLAFLVK